MQHWWFVWVRRIAVVCALAALAAAPPAMAQAPTSNIVFTKTGPSTASPGDTFFYTITATNTASINSEEILIDDTLPPQVVYVGHTTQSTSGAIWICGFDSVETINCNGSPLDPGEFHRVTVEVMLSELAVPGTTVTNTAVASEGVGRGAPEDRGGPLSATDPAMPKSAVHPLQVVGPDVTVQKSHVGNGTRGTQLTYSIVATNVGGFATAGVTTLTDTLPGGLTPVSFSGAGWTCTLAPLQCTHPAGVAAGNAMPQLSLVVAVDANAPASVTNVVAVSTPGDANGNNNTASDPTTIVTSGDLLITKTGTPSANAGTNVTYQINVSNLGVSPATTLVMTDTLPASLTFVSLAAPAGWACTTPAVGASGTIACASPSLAAGGTSGPFALTARIADAAAGTLTNTASISSASTDANPANNTASFSTDVLAAPRTSLSLGLSFSSPIYYAVGQTIEVRYLVTNTSGTTVNAIVVTDPNVPVITCPQTSLTIAASMTCTGPYATTAADVAAGVSPFTATVAGSGGATATAAGSIVSTAAAVQNAFNQLVPMPVVVNPPGLHDRIGASGISLSESGGEPTLNFAATLLAGAGEAAAVLAGGEIRLPVKLWIDGTLTLHTQNLGEGVTGLVGLGADYLVNDDVLIGAALYADVSSRTLAAGTLKGRGVVFGPYISAAVTPHITVDAGIFYGGSVQDAAATVGGVAFTGSYTTERVLARARLDGLWTMGAVTVRPDATFYLSHETADGYLVRDAQGNAVPVAGFTSIYLDLSAGTVIERPIALENGLVLIPRAGLRIGVGGQGSTVVLNDPYGTASVGFILKGDAWKFETSVETSLYASSLNALRYKAGVSGEF